MTQRFGGVFSSLSTRDWQYLDRVMEEHPLYNPATTDLPSLNDMSNKDILNMLDEYDDALTNLVTSRRQIPEVALEKENLDYLTEFRQVKAQLKNIRKRLASKIRRSR